MEYLTARAARTRRAVESWAEHNDCGGAPIAALTAAAIAEAERRRMDLDVAALHAVLANAVRAWKHEQEQAAAEEARRSAAETERWEYLQRRQRDYRLLANDNRIPPKKPAA